MSYEIIARTELKDGTKIQLEDWHPCNTEEYPNFYGYTIGAYPIAKNSSKYNIIRKDETFRFAIERNEYKGITDRMILDDWVSLCKGDKTLEDLATHVSDKKYLYYLGVIDEEPAI